MKEIVELFEKEYVMTEKADGTLVLKPTVRPSDKRNALKEYTTQELVDEVWRRTDEAIEQKRKEDEEWKTLLESDINMI